MRYHALVTDYDGTLAHDGRVEPDTIRALERLRASGRRAILVTGREIEDLRATFDRTDLFDRIVAENGALLVDPSTRAERLLCERPPDAFVAALRARMVTPLSVGHAIVATWEPNDRIVLDVIRELGLELEIIFNKGAVMVLPSGVNKASGLRSALEDLGLSAHNAVAIGDAQNDHAFLSICEAAVAVANALPMLQERADLVTRGERGAGVTDSSTLCSRTTWRRLPRALVVMPSRSAGARTGRRSCCRRSVATCSSVVRRAPASRHSRRPSSRASSSTSTSSA